MAESYNANLDKLIGKMEAQRNKQRAAVSPKSGLTAMQKAGKRTRYQRFANFIFRD